MATDKKPKPPAPNPAPQQQQQPPVVVQQTPQNDGWDLPTVYSLAGNGGSGNLDWNDPDD